MTLKKISSDDSVKYIPSMNTWLSENSYDHKAKTVSSLRKQNKITSRSIKKFIENITAEGFRILK